MIRDRITTAIADHRRYASLEDHTPEQLADAILAAVPEIAALEQQRCRECGGNLVELDLALGEGLCALCRDVAGAVV